VCPPFPVPSFLGLEETAQTKRKEKKNEKQLLMGPCRGRTHADGSSGSWTQSYFGSFSGQDPT